MTFNPALAPSRLLNRALQHPRGGRVGRGFTTKVLPLGLEVARGSRRHHLRRRHVVLPRCCIGDLVSRELFETPRTNSRASSNLPHNRNDSSILPLPTQFLQDFDSKLFDPLTFQRNDVHFDIIDGKPPLPQKNTLNAEHGENITPSKMPSDWMSSYAERWRANADDFDDCSLLSVESASSTSTSTSITSKRTEMQQLLTSTNTTKRILWSNWTEEMIRDPKTSPILFCYNDLIDGKGNDRNASSENVCEQRRLLSVLYQYGLVLISGTPTYTDSLSVHDMSESSKESRMRVINSSSNAEDGDYTSAESALLHLASIVGYHPMHTLYGEGVWSTSSYSSFYNTKDDGESEDESNRSSAASTADSSYGSTSLPLHTDMTYISNPPGVQVFLMVQPAEPAVSSASGNTKNGESEAAIAPKGQSVYLDGFAAARQLLRENPDAYRILASTSRRYRCIDADLGWHLEASGPIIESIPSGGLGGCGAPPVKAIRHNDLDRLPDLPPYPSTNDTDMNTIEYDSFYCSLREAHEAWDDILRRDSMRFVIDLQAGDCVLVANQRCMHGRYAFETSKYPRVIMGCYVGMDELSSKWRKAGLPVL